MARNNFDTFPTKNAHYKIHFGLSTCRRRRRRCCWSDKSSMNSYILCFTLQLSQKQARQFNPVTLKCQHSPPNRLLQIHIVHGVRVRVRMRAPDFCFPYFSLGYAFGAKQKKNSKYPESDGCALSGYFFFVRSFVRSFFHVLFDMNCVCVYKLHLHVARESRAV